MIIFYSENASTLTFGLHRRLNESLANLQFQRVEVNKKNSLDFQLCSYLGYLICDTMCKPGENSKNNYYIVSNDLAYVVLADYWKRRGIDVRVVKNLTKAETGIAPAKTPATPPQPSTHPTVKVTASVNKNPAPPNNKSDALENKLSAILPNKQDISEAVKIIKGSSIKNSSEKVALNNVLCKKFGSQTGGKIYQIAKSFITKS